MDWRGQKDAEALMRLLLAASAAAALLASYLPADYRLMLVLYAGGAALTALAAVPDWPVFSHHPLR